MEHQEIQQQKSLEGSLPEEGIAYEVPPSLLSGVLDRIEQHHIYLTSKVPAEDLQAALSHPRWEIRAAAVRSLGQKGELQPVLAALEDEHRLVRSTAVSVLGTFGARLPLEWLIRMLRDPAWEVREMAVLALGRLYEQRKSTTLHALLLATQQDTSERVRDAVRAALQVRDTPSTPIDARSKLIYSLGAWKRAFFHLPRDAQRDF
jgi:hypothetical protein